MHGGTGVWHHQIGARLPTVSAARIESGVRRMDVGQHRLEFETDVQSAAAKAAGPRGLTEAQADSFSVVADTCNPKTACLPKLFQRMTSAASEKFAFKEFLADLSPTGC